MRLRLARHAAAGILAGTAISACVAEVPSETAVEAGYLAKFAPFVEWPATAFGNASDPITICISGQDPFGALLADAVRGQSVNGRTVAIRHIDSDRPGAPCHILFAGGDGTEDMLRAAAHQPILTVTDRSRGGIGGMIQFVMVGGRVRFLIDRGAAHDNGIVISSKLLELAVGVAR